MKRSADLSAYHRGYLEGYRAGLADGLAGETPRGQLETIAGLPLACLELPTRVCNALEALSCQTVGDVAALSESQIRYARGLGAVGAGEVARALQRHEIRDTPWTLFLPEE